VANELTLAQFKVALGELHDAIGTVQSAADAIDDSCSTIKGQFDVVESAWTGPAGSTFVELTPVVTQVMDSLTQLLHDTVSRMQTTYENYLSVEEQNTKNVSPGGGNGGGGNGGGGDGGGGSSEKPVRTASSGGSGKATPRAGMVEAGQPVAAAVVESVATPRADPNL
jgi:WXG100 family type VII secretion target